MAAIQFAVGERVKARASLFVRTGTILKHDRQSCPSYER